MAEEFFFRSCRVGNGESQSIDHHRKAEMMRELLYYLGVSLVPHILLGTR